MPAAWWSVVSVLLTCPPLPQRQPRETLSRRRRGVVQLLISSPRPHTSTRRGWLPRRPSTTTVIVAVCQERGKPSDDGVNWATIVPPPPLLFLSLLRDTRARWPLAPTRPWPSRGTKVARIALPSRNHEGVRVQYIYSELRSMVKDC